MTYYTEFFNLNVIILGNVNFIGTMLSSAYPLPFARFFRIGE